MLILVDPSSHGRVFVEISPLSPSTSATSSTGGNPSVPIKLQGKPVVATGGVRKEESARAQVTIKYQLLNPEEAFRDIVHDARAVILAGGTMTPVSLPGFLCLLLSACLTELLVHPWFLSQMSDFSTQLFSYLSPAKIRTFSCGHVIPPKNLQCLVLMQGPRKIDLLWKFDRRSDSGMVCVGPAQPRSSFPFMYMITLMHHAYLDRRVGPHARQHRHHRTEWTRSLCSFVCLPRAGEESMGDKWVDREVGSQEEGFLRTEASRRGGRGRREWWRRRRRRD